MKQREPPDAGQGLLGEASQRPSRCLVTLNRVFKRLTGTAYPYLAYFLTLLVLYTVITSAPLL
ncbi:MAG: hypothetical protein ACTSVD_04955 [Candidatus Thorarchaeota archaeon]